MAVEYKEKRRHPRYALDTGVRIHQEQGGGGFWGTLSDISIGGCYIYTFSPLAVNQGVVLAIKANDKEISVSAKTVSSHPGVGMGVAFGSFVTPDSEARLKALIDQLASRPKSTTEPIGVFR
jgi:PilZ domain